MDSIIKWRGGKSRLAKKIVSYFPNHTCYVEAFGGAAWVLFAKEVGTSKHEVLNDKHAELSNFWNVVATKSVQLFEAMKWDIKSRHTYDMLRKADLTSMTDIERARRLYWMTKCSFGGSYADVFGTDKKGAAPANFGSLEEKLRLINTRLKKVTIECKDYRALPKIYDSQDTLWFLDPPYLGTITIGYEEKLNLSEFVPFVKSLKGKVAITHNINETIKEHFKDWNFIELGRRQNCIGNNGKAAGTFANEWLITNYQI